MVTDSGTESGSMPRIVLAPQVIDLHIHSSASTKTRDKGDKALALCDVGGIPGLVGRLSEEGVGVTMCAITDHDCFDYELYQELKRFEGQGTLQCVLPGVEFTVDYSESDGSVNTDDKTNSKPTRIHIVAVFDDRKPGVLAQLNDAISDSLGKPSYDSGDAFSSEKFTKILRAIGLDVVLIGHEKSAGQERKCDISSLGHELADEVILTEFVDAIELKNRHKELDIKELISSYSKTDVPFVLGGDCHDWSVYPCKDQTFVGREDETAFSRVKCLPSFKGLVMAITDHSRIKVGDHAFFSAASAMQETLDLSVGGDKVSVPLSPGINVLIGDNSIGKSFILHKAMRYRELSSKELAAGYDAYCKKEKFDVVTEIPAAKILWFDDQESVRKTLESLHAGESEGEVFEEYFERHANIEGSKRAVERLFEACLNSLDGKLAYNDCLEALKGCSVSVQVVRPSLSLSLSTKIPKEKMKEVDDLVNAVKLEITQLEEIREKNANIFGKLDEEAQLVFAEAIEKLRLFLEFAEAKQKEMAFQNTKIEAVVAAAKKEQGRLRKLKTDEEVRSEAYSEELRSVSQKMAEACELRNRRRDVPFEVKDAPGHTASTPMGSFLFVSERRPEKLDDAYLRGVMEKVFNKGDIDGIIEGFSHPTSLVTSDVASAVSRDKPDADKCMTVVSQKLKAAIEESISERLKITNDQIGVDSEPSPGLYAQIYFDLMAEKDDFGMYIIDQPEDQISQTAIRKHVLGSFKRMSERRQVIMVTHNPQFVVNLDVDNVISLARGEDGQIKVQSGALEYDCGEYNILDVVAETVEGGADVVRKRLKRYGS